MCPLCLLTLQQPGEETEEREILAQMAALAVGEGEEEDESVLRKYSKGISHVESLLALDRLKQVGQRGDINKQNAIFGTVILQNIGG